MSEIENNKNQIQYVYPSQFQTHYEDDGINLVDLWIALKEYKKTFLSYFIIMIFLISTVIFSLYKEKFELTSSLQIGTLNVNGNVRSIDSLEATKSKIEDVLIPSAKLKYNLKSDFKTVIKTSKGSDVLLLKNKTVPDDVEFYIGFQNSVLSSLIKDHKYKVSITQTELKRALKTEELQLNILNDPETLRILLQEQINEINNNETLLAQLKENYKLLESGGYNSVLSKVSTEDLSKLITKDGRIMDELVKIRFEGLLLNNKSDQQKLLNKIEIIKLNKTKIAKSHAEKIKKEQLKIDEIKQKIAEVNHTEVLSNPILSSEPVGLKLKVLLIIAVFVSGFVAFIGVLLAMFRDKVAERIAKKEALKVSQ